jgi:hypothetical protein
LLLLVPSSLDVAPEGRTLPVFDGDNLTFTCVTTPSRPPPLVWWYRGGGVLITDGVENTLTTLDILYIVNSTLSIVVNMTRDQGDIFCRTSNIQNVAAVDSPKVTLDGPGKYIASSFNAYKFKTVSVFFKLLHVCSINL